MTYFGLKNAEIAGNDTITGFDAPGMSRSGCP
jgi:hypothetical protein